MASRNVALARAFPIVIGIVVFGAIIVFLALRTVRGIEQSQAVAARFEGLAGRCEVGTAEGDQNGQGRQTAAEQGAAEGVLPGAALRLVEGAWVYDATVLPAEWRAETAEAVKVVLCLGPSQPLVTTACEVDASGAAPTRVYGEALTVRLVDVESGLLLAEEVLESAAVTGCRDEVDVVRVEGEVIEGWVREAVEE